MWNSSVSTSDVALGISREEAERRALSMLETLGPRDESTTKVSFDEHLPDVLHALVQELARRNSTSEHYEALCGLHRFVIGLDWPGDEFDEKAQLLMHISQLAWSQALKRGNASEARRWEEECLQHFLSQESAQQLLGLPVSNWSPAVCERFLSDRAVLLGLWKWLDGRSDSSPRAVFELALVAHKWLSRHCGTGEESYLLAQLSMVLAGTLRMRGQYEKSRGWLQVAEESSKGSSNIEALQARIEYVRLGVMFDTYQSSRVLAQVPRLIERFDELGLSDDVAKCKYLLAMCQKESLGDQEALPLFLLLKTEPAVMRQPWFKAIVLVNLAGIQSNEGDLGTAYCSIKEAEALLLDSAKPFAEAHCCGVMGEILRDNGNHIAAVAYYRRSLEIYLSVDMAAFAAYQRLLLAETLLATGAVDEAVDEIVAALPIIEREQLVREGIAAVGLLKASLAGRKLDSEALKVLRESLNRSRQEAEP